MASDTPFRIHPEVELLRDEIIETRRHLHAHPELSFKEFETAKFVAQKLREYGLEVTEGVAQTGVVATLRGALPGPCIAFRADMDALPIAETSDCPFASQNPGAMHACGHDGHMAQLLGAVKVLVGKRDRIKGSIKLLFQPAEEGYGGGRVMVAEGVMDGVDAVYGCHLWTYDEVGVVGVRQGPVMAASDRFEILVEGEGGHGAAPQGTVDAVVAASHVVCALQTVVSRNVDPLKSAVVTVGQINGGYNYNIIADRVTVVGTARTMERGVQELLVRRMNEVATFTAKAHGAKATLSYYFGYPSTVNSSAACCEHVRAAGQRVVGEALVRHPFASMGAEDFSYFLHEAPGCFFFVGASPVKEGEPKVPHHRSDFAIDERSLLVAASVFVGLAELLLIEPEDPVALMAQVRRDWVKPPPPPKAGYATLPVLCSCHHH